MKLTYRVFRSAIIAGFCIALGGTVFLTLGGIIGAILFTFGLLTVVHYGFRLYTGTAGFFEPTSFEEWWFLFVIIIGNIVGCLGMAAIVSQTMPNLIAPSSDILSKRIEAGWFNDGLLAICCGFIMTTAVKFGRDNMFLPLLFGVPLFIMCGFVHSIADAFYFLCNPLDSLCNTTVLGIYASELCGNLIGCNLVRIIYFDKNI